MKGLLKAAFLFGAVAALSGCASMAGKEVIATRNAPEAIGPYSQGIKVGNMVFLAGQIPIDPKTNQLNTGSIEEQTKLVLENLPLVLAGGVLGAIVANWTVRALVPLIPVDLPRADERELVVDRVAALLAQVVGQVRDELAVRLLQHR